VQGRPNWLFVKLHTHGGIPSNYKTLLGEAMAGFHRSLGEFCLNSGIRLHYVTARELVNVVHAAEDGHSGNAGDYRDHRYQLLESPITHHA
jgi:hypothetical protein